MISYQPLDNNPNFFRLFLSLEILVLMPIHYNLSD
jgi:hypothetical protein